MDPGGKGSGWEKALLSQSPPSHICSKAWEPLASLWGTGLSRGHGECMQQGEGTRPSGAALLRAQFTGCLLKPCQTLFLQSLGGCATRRHSSVTPLFCMGDNHICQPVLSMLRSQEEVTSTLTLT